MKRDESASLVIFLILAIVLLFGIFEGLWSLSAVLEYVPYFIMAGMLAVLLYGFREKIDKALKGGGTTESIDSKIMWAQMKRLQDQPRRDALTDLLQLVYRPLSSAVLEMKEGKDALPKAGTVGNYNNPWTLNPKIIAQVVDVFNKHLALIENDEVRKGWEENKEYLRKGEFWYGERQRKWLESIEREHNRIRWERDSP